MRESYSLVMVHRASHFSGFCCCRAWALRSQASLVVARGLSFLKACGILISWSGIEPEFPVLEGGLLTTGPPGRFSFISVNKHPKILSHFLLFIANFIQMVLFYNALPFCFVLHSLLCLWGPILGPADLADALWLLPGISHVNSIRPDLLFF